MRRFDEDDKLIWLFTSSQTSQVGHTEVLSACLMARLDRKVCVAARIALDESILSY